MKIAQIVAFSLAFTCCCVVSSARAEDHEEKVKVETKTENGKHELRMKVTRHDDGHYYGHYNNREYLLRGDAKFTTDGEYYVDGDVDAGNTYITTRSYRPYVVEERRVIEERRDPLIKVGPLEIGR
jgi:hypothetical protein